MCIYKQRLVISNICVFINLFELMQSVEAQVFIRILNFAMKNENKRLTRLHTRFYLHELRLGNKILLKILSSIYSLNII